MDAMSPGEPSWMLAGVMYPGRRIPASWVHDANTLHALIEQCRSHVLAMEQEAEAAFRAAREAGWRQGREEAVAQGVATLVQAHEEAQNYLQNAELRIAHLVMAVVRRVLPTLDALAVMNALVQDALKAMQSERCIGIRVPPEYLEAVSRTLASGTVTCSNGHQVQVHCVADPALGLDECVVASPHGEIRMGLFRQTHALGAALLSAAESKRYCGAGNR